MAKGEDMDRQKKKILIVDDEADFTKIIKFNLDSLGKYEVLAENKAKNALSAAISFKPDLILLDIMMPDIDGGEVARQIEAEASTRGIPIVFLTAALTKEEAASCKGGKIGGYVYIAKPVTLKELVDCIERNIIK